MILPGRLSAEEVFPAGYANLRAYFIELASGLRVRVVEAGNVASPPVVCLPGFGCSTYIFRHTLVPLASAGYRAIAVDLKGHGLSDKPADASGYTLEAMRAHVIEILDALGLQSVRLIGLSMGAALAAHVAAAIPERVPNVVLVSTVGFDGVPGLSVVQAFTPEAVTKLAPRIANRSLVRLMLRGVYGKLRDFSERDVEEYWAPTQFPEFVTAMRHLLHEFDWKATFPALPMRWMAIAGTMDYLARRGTVEEAARTRPEGELLVVEGAGHVVLDESPDFVNASIIRFFKATAGRPYIAPQNDTN